MNTGEVVAADPVEGPRLRHGRRGERRGTARAGRGPGRDLPGRADVCARARCGRGRVGRRPRAQGQGRAGAGLQAPDPSPTVEGVARRLDSPLVGREEELSRAHGRVRRRRRGASCELAPWSANAGVGKSRLTRELLTTVEDQARVLQGRCLPYGEGITFWPVAEALKAAAGIADDESAGTAQAKLAALVPAGEDADAVVGPIASAVGLSTRRPALRRSSVPSGACWRCSPNEQPLLLVFDDIHWAEETFLDLVEYLADSSKEAPILMLCLSRPEIWELRPSVTAAAARGRRWSSFRSMRATAAADRERARPGRRAARSSPHESPKRPRAIRCSWRRCCACCWIRACSSAATGHGW